MENIFSLPAQGIANKQYLKFASAGGQKNCQVTLTDNGVRIYRPPNITYSSSDSSTRTMWGGIKIINQGTDGIRPQSADDNYFNLVQNHTYIIRFHVSGKSSVAFGMRNWGSNMGWDRAAMMPDPTNVKANNIPANFTGDFECYYEFTISDDIFKTCNNAYSSYVAGNTYLSYRHFELGFNYGNTGTLGTDLYITNLRMYDITNNEKNYSITKEGIILPAQVIEMPIAQASIQSSGDLICNNFYEY